MMIPGRILIVDDKKGEVNDLINEFFRMGEHVIYSGLPVENEFYDNVRLLILDYWLDENNEASSLESITTIINEVAEKSKFFMIVIWSAKVTQENKDEIKRKIKGKYEGRFTQDLPGILLDPISKGELSYNKLIKKIHVDIESFPNLNLIFEIEKIVDQAKDKVKTQIYEIGNWSNLIKSLNKEYDRDSIRRQILHMYINILRRNIDATDRLSSSVDKLLDFNETFNVEDFGNVYSAQYYYSPSKKEQICTGDILKLKTNGKYYMIITPECDITHDKHTSTKLVEASRINHSELFASQPLEEIAELFNIRTNEVVEAIIRERNLRSNYCRLAFLIDVDTHDFFHLVFDFNKMKSLKKAKNMSDLSNYKRTCRVDYPLINSFLQKYAAFCLRSGTISIPKEVVTDLRAKLALQEN